jgi:hypothetical protein
MEIAITLRSHSLKQLDPWAMARNECYFQDFLEYAQDLTNQILSALDHKARRFWFKRRKEQEVI